jgi:hypothetical protein
MTLTCQVVSIHHGKQYWDGNRRVTIMVEEADFAENKFRIENDTLELGQVFTLKMESDK